MSSRQIDPKTTQGTNPTQSRMTGEERFDMDPLSKADRENQGWLSGDQFTISETPVAHINQTVGTKL